MSILVHASFKPIFVEATLCVRHSAEYWKGSGDREVILVRMEIAF